MGDLQGNVRLPDRQDCDGIDAINWFSGANPLKASGTGNVRLPVPHSTWTSDHHNITYFYPAGWKFT